MPTSPPGSKRAAGHFNSDIGMTTPSALITRKALNPYEEAKAVRAISEASDIARYVKPGVI